MNQVVMGMGELGTAVAQVTRSDVSYDFDKKRTVGTIPKDLDVMHICYPYSEDFIAYARVDIKNYKPKHVVVWSTVPIGTCRQIGEKVVHSPVEGIHPLLADSILKMCRYIGWNDGAEGRFFVDYFLKLGLDTRDVSNTETTELLKLRSTAKYGVNLVWAQYEAELCKKFEVAYTEVMQYDTDYNNLYKELGEAYVARYVLYPPGGEIGGHCVVPNAKLLNEQMPSDLLDKIIAMGKK